VASNLLGLIIGGVLPAILYGVSAIFAKFSANAGVPVGWHLFWVGLAVSATGVLLQLFLPGAMPSRFVIASSSMQGALWGLGTGFVVLGILKFQAPLAKLTPLYNMNTLITVGLALFIFAEWQQARPLHLILGAILIVIGGIIVSRA
jgi:transporter family protein